MKKTLIILLTLCLISSFTVPSYAAFAVNEYEIIFKTKPSYEGTEYEDVFSDHKNFFDPDAFGIPGISSVSIYGAVYGKNSQDNMPCYILRALTGFGSLYEASEICEELKSCGIAAWAVVTRLNGFKAFDKILDAYIGAERKFIELSTDTAGDIDCSNSVTAEDVRTALRIAVGLENKADYPYLMGDMDFDGAVTSADARDILRVSVGIYGYLTLD